jgi:hypothetical protein
MQKRESKISKVAKGLQRAKSVLPAARKKDSSVVQILGIEPILIDDHTRKKQQLETNIDKMTRYGNIPEALFTRKEIQTEDQAAFRMTLRDIEDKIDENKKDLNSKSKTVLQMPNLAGLRKIFSKNKVTWDGLSSLNRSIKHSDSGSNYG